MGHKNPCTEVSVKTIEEGLNLQMCLQGYALVWARLGQGDLEILETLGQQLRTSHSFQHQSGAIKQ